MQTQNIIGRYEGEMDSRSNELQTRKHTEILKPHNAKWKHENVQVML